MSANDLPEDSTLIFKELDIPGRTGPVSQSPKVWGINIAAARDNFPRQGLLCRAGPWTNMGVGDKLVIYWGAGQQVLQETIDENEKNTQLQMFVPPARITDGTFPVSYSVTRLNQTPEPSEVMTVRVKLTRPGGHDDNDQPGHSKLLMSLPKEIITGGIDKDNVAAGVPITIGAASSAPYPNAAAGDVIQVSWGGVFVLSNPLTQDQADGKTPVIVHIGEATIREAEDSDHAGLAVAFEVYDVVDNRSEDWSAEQRVLVAIDATLLVAPILDEAHNNVLDVDKLGDADGTAQIWAAGASFKVGDTPVLRIRGTPVEGAPIDVQIRGTALISEPSVHKTKIPNAVLRQLAKSQIALSYQLEKADGSPTLRAKTQFISAIGEVQRLKAPVAHGVVSGALDPTLAQVLIDIPFDNSFAAGQSIKLFWLGTRPELTPYLPDLPLRSITQGDIDKKLPLRIIVPGAHLTPINGGKLELYYQLIIDDGVRKTMNRVNARHAIRESIHAAVLQIGEPRLELPEPVVAGVVDGVLPADTQGTTLTVEYLNTVKDDEVVYEWFGSKTGKLYDSLILNTVTAGKPVEFTIDAKMIKDNEGGSVSASYLIKRTAGGTSYSNPLDFRVGVALDLKEPRIKEADGTSLDPFAAKDNLTAIVDYTGMAIGDDIIVTWTGTTPNGSDTSATTPVTTLGPQSIPLKNAVVAFNLGKAVTVSYTVTRGGAPVPSQELQLTVLAVPHEHAELPKATIDGASNDDLDVITLANNAFTRVTTWPLIAANQKIWLRYTGIKADGSEYKKATYEGVPLLGNGVIAGPYPATPVAELRGLKDNSKLEIEFKVTFDGSTDEAKAVTFPPRVYNVKAVEDVRPVISTVTDSKGDEIPHNGGTVDPKIKLTGKAAPLQEVEVFEGAATKGKYTANDAGIWICETTLTGIGTRTFTAKAQYGTGQISIGRIFTLSNALKPGITSVKDSKGVEIPDKGTTLDTTVKLTGNATPRLKVEIFDGGSTKGTANVGANGIWEREVTGLNVAAHSFKAKALYGSGLESDIRELQVVAQVTPSITNVTDSKGTVAPNGSTFDRSVTVTGTASPNQKVRLRDGTNTLHEPTANGSGVWTQVVSGLTVKAYSLTALALYGDGPVSTPARTFTVAQAVTPTITNVTDSKGTVAPNGSTFDRSVTVTGTASPNQKVRLRDGTNTLHEPTANGSGVWTQVVSGLTVKAYSLTALALYGDGPVSTPARTFTVAQAVTPTITNVTDSKGTVAPNGSTFDRSVTVTGTASPNQKVRLRDGTNTLHEPTANGSGVWTQVVSGLTVKAYSLTALALYGTGPVSTPARTFTVAQAVTPTITNVTDSKGTVAPNGSTFDRSVTVTGTASPNQKVRLRDGTNTLHEPTANGSGVWTQVVSGLTVKAYSLTALALYGDGPVSTPARTFTVAQAVTPTITNVTDSKGTVAPNGSTFDRSVTVTGTASPNQKVRLRDGANTLHEPTANGSGVWTQVVSGLTVKAYSLTALALYGDGPVSTPARTFTVAQAVTPTITNVTDSKGSVPQGGLTFDNTVTITGTASPNQKVRLIQGDIPLHEPLASNSGLWSQTLNVQVGNFYNLTALALYGDNPVSAPPRTFIPRTGLVRDFTDFTNQNWNGWAAGSGVRPGDLTLFLDTGDNWRLLNKTHTEQSSGVIIQKRLTNVHFTGQYRFKVRVRRFDDKGAVPRISLRARGETITGPSQIRSSVEWTTLTGIFIAAGTDVTVDMYSHVSTGDGNDYVIDDIEIFAV